MNRYWPNHRLNRTPESISALRGWWLGRCGFAVSWSRKKRWFRRLVAMAGGLLSVACSVNARADDPIVYGLCEGDVQSVELQMEEGDFRATVLLSSDASEAFATFTEMNVGKRVIVAAGDSVLSDAFIRERIDSGRLVSFSAGEEEAGRLRDALLGTLPRSRCGPAVGRQRGGPR